MLAGAAILFVLATAIVAFQGWPRIASQGSSPSLQVGPAPVSGSRVSRRLRAAGLGYPAPVVIRHPVAPRRPARTAASAARPVGFRTPSAPGRSGSRSGHGGSTRGASGTGTGGSGHRGAGSGGGEISVSPPTKPPITISVPVGQLAGTAENVARTVAGTAGNAIQKVGGTVGGVLGKIGPVLGP